MLYQAGPTTGSYPTTNSWPRFSLGNVPQQVQNEWDSAPRIPSTI